MFKTSLDEYKKLRWLGCASLSLCYVATQKFDSYEELGIKIWDVAAGIAILEAANIKVNYSFNNNQTMDILAENYGKE